MNVVFRVDASIHIGTGHVMRCLTLADELTQQGHECWFICREHPGHLGDVIISKGYNFSLLTAKTVATLQLEKSASADYAHWLGVPWQEDANQTLDAIKKIKVDWLVVDHYALDSKWESVVRKVCSHIMVIDDLGDREHLCDVLVDQNYGSTAAKYQLKVPGGCKLLTGANYSLLRPEFSEWREKSLSRRGNPVLRHVLITMGGTDPDNYTGQILEALRTCRLPDNLVITVVLGETAPHCDAVQSLALKMPVRTEVKVNVKNMAELMARADLAIGAAGATTWERCCLGLPTLQMVLAQNQAEIGNCLAKRGAALLIHKADEIELLITSIDTQMLKALSAESCEITDGLGVFKVVEILQEEFYGN
jgi:UDP-2,4-diacetamido-2,4,6-trideoxy-beta-L-altropyranose hydrolase